jgi:hypothetical protein
MSYQKTNFSIQRNGLKLSVTKGSGTTEIPAWRRAHMSNLVSAFDFDHVSILRSVYFCAPTDAYTA